MPALTDPPQTKIATATDAGPWDDFVRSHADGTVEHLFAWQPIFRDVFHQRPVYLIAQTAGAVRGVLPLVCVPSLLLGKTVVSLPYTSYGGLLATDAPTADALAAHAGTIAAKFGAARLEFRNSHRYFERSACRQHKVGARLPLPATSDALWTSLDRKVRNQIRKAQKEGLVVERGGGELLESFYKVFAENMRDLGTPVFPRALFEHALRAVPDSSVFVVRLNSTPVAASITLGWRDSVLVPWASALRRYRHLSPNMLLYWSMLEHAVAGGYNVFDFGRSTRDGGTHQFKLQWGAKDFSLYWESLVPGERATVEPSGSGAGLAAFVSLWQRLPLPLANAAGPFVIRHVV